MSDSSKAREGRATRRDRSRRKAAPDGALVASVSFPGAKLVGRASTESTSSLVSDFISAAKSCDSAKACGTLSLYRTDGKTDAASDALDEAKWSSFRNSIAAVVSVGRTVKYGQSLHGGEYFLLWTPKSASVESGSHGSATAQRLKSVGVVVDEGVGITRQVVAGWLLAFPKDFSGRRDALRAFHEMTRGEMAKAFEQALNDEAASRPQSTYEDKKTLAKWVNAELRELGLTIRCPRTGRPALLRGNAGGRPGIGRFHLEITDAGGVQRRTVTSVDLPRVALEPDDLERSPYGERHTRGR